MHPVSSAPFGEHFIRLVVTKGLLQLGLFGWDQMVRRHPTQFTQVIHADFELNRSAGKVGEFGCHPIGATQSISTSERQIATPDIWTKSRVVRRHILIAGLKRSGQHGAVDTREPPP